VEITKRLELLEAQLKLVETYSVQGFWHALDRAYEAILPRIELNCIVCGHRGGRSGFKIHSSRCQFGGGHLERYECPNCGAIFGPQKYLNLDEIFVTADYNLLYSRYAESDSTANEIRTFRSTSPESGRLYLNWGCGAWCKTIPQLRAQSFDVWGYEPSADKTDGFIVKNRGEVSAKFDAIFSNNVIEHFRDPVAQFEDFKTILTADGRMAHSSPCYDYSYPFTRFHTLFLTGRSPHVLAERTGFSAREVVRDGEYINFVFARMPN
jgi:hypothetical protein